DLGRTDLAGDVAPVDQHPRADQRDRGPVQHGLEPRSVVGLHPGLPHRPRQGAVESTRAHEAEPQPPRQLPRHGGLARSRWAVDRDHRLLPPGARHGDVTAQGRPASALSAWTKPGNDVAMQPVSSTTVDPSATSPATTRAMAIRWSPALWTVAPRRRRPPRISRPSGSSTMSAPMRPSSVAMAWIRSDSLTRSSAASR